MSAPAAVPSAGQAAERELARGRRIIPVPHGEKEPTLPEWQKLRLEAADLPRYFNGQRMNLGMLNGQPSRTVDVDLDAMEALQLADHFLPLIQLLRRRHGEVRGRRQASR